MGDVCVKIEPITSTHLRREMRTWGSWNPKERSHIVFMIWCWENDPVVLCQIKFHFVCDFWCVKSRIVHEIFQVCSWWCSWNGTEIVDNGSDVMDVLAYPSSDFGVFFVADPVVDAWRQAGADPKWFHLYLRLCHRTHRSQLTQLTDLTRSLTDFILTDDNATQPHKFRQYR